MRSGPFRWIVPAGALVIAGALLAVVLPRVTGIGWKTNGDTVADIPLMQLSELLAVWFAGLWVHTLMLRAALPGLQTRRAFALNLGGSSVSNVLPLGGAAGVGLNYAMLRSWGYNRVEISAFTAVSNLVVAVIKIFIALAGVAILLMSPVVRPQLPLPHMGTGTIAIVLALAAAAIAVGRLIWRSKRAAATRQAIRLTVSEAVRSMRNGWRAMAIGGLGYPALQAVLLWLCLRATGAHVGVAVVLLTYAVERLLTLVPITPGGVGVVETGASAVLLAFGVDPASAVGGFLLFRVFSFLVEIPVGGAVTLWWFMRSRHRAELTPALTDR